MEIFMNTTKSSLTPTFIAIGTLILSSVANAENRLNGRQAADVCKQEITAAYSGNNQIKFGRNPASSMKSGAFKFWINSTESTNGDKNSVRYLCEITRAGKLVALTREDGRWKI